MALIWALGGVAEDTLSWAVCYHLDIARRHATSAGSGRVRERWRRAAARAGAAHDALGDGCRDGGRLQAGGLIKSLLPLLCLQIQGLRL